MNLSSTTAAREFQARIAPVLSRAGAYAFAIVRNRADAEDAVQDAALKAYRAFAKYDESRSFKGWWFAILRNCCRDLVRRRRSRPSAIDPGQAESSPQPGPSPGQYDDLRDALEQLSAAHREILRLRYFGDCSYKDIAAALDIPAGTVMSRLHAARQALAAVYRKDPA